MTPAPILRLGPALAEVRHKFADDFGRSEPCQPFDPYLRGQLSHRQRKSLAPIALFNPSAPRTQPAFLHSAVCDQPHGYLTLVSHLFLARQTERLWGENPGIHPEPGWRRCQRVGQPATVCGCPPHRLPQACVDDPAGHPDWQPTRPSTTGRRRRHVLGVFTSRRRSCIPP